MSVSGSGHAININITMWSLLRRRDYRQRTDKEIDMRGIHELKTFLKTFTNDPRLLFACAHSRPRIFVAPLLHNL